MWNRKELKTKAKEVVRKSYWSLVVVCFIIALLTGEYGTSIIIKLNQGESIIPSYIKESNFYQENTKLTEMENKINNSEEMQKKIIETAKVNVQSMIKEQIYIIKVVDATKFFSIKENKQGLSISIVASIAVVFIIFIVEPLRVAGKRFFIKARKEEGTKVTVLKEIFKKENLGNVAITMLKKNIYNTLWYLTIIGGFIKTYQYKMIPYILAENPQIEAKEAFKISKEMMKHNKWKAFILDLSFLGWNILSMLTFGLLNLLYTNPYKAITMTELYVTLKENINLENTEIK